MLAAPPYPLAVGLAGDRDRLHRPTRRRWKTQSPALLPFSPATCGSSTPVHPLQAVAPSAGQGSTPLRCAAQPSPLRHEMPASSLPLSPLRLEMPAASPPRQHFSATMLMRATAPKLGHQQVVPAVLATCSGSAGSPGCVHFSIPVAVLGAPAACTSPYQRQFCDGFALSSDGPLTRWMSFDDSDAVRDRPSRATRAAQSRAACDAAASLTTRATSSTSDGDVVAWERVTTAMT